MKHENVAQLVLLRIENYVDNFVLHARKGNW